MEKKSNQFIFQLVEREKQEALSQLAFFPSA